MRIEDKIYPRVLIVSHNVLSPSTNMGKTMVDFFSGWNQSNIAQLYFRNEVPTSEICKHYFRITDFNMLGSLIKLNYQTDPNQIFQEDSDFQDSIYQMGARRKSSGYFFRNLLWQTKLWKTPELMSWIAEYDPEVVFYAAGDYTFSMKIALDICHEKDIPLAVYFGDDFYFSGQPQSKLSLFNRTNTKQFRRQFEKLFSYLSTFTAATDKLNDRYSSYFGKKGFAIMNSAKIRKENKIEEKDIKISYIGNLILNRWKSLIDIGCCLKELGLVLDVYSMEEDPKILSQMKPVNGIHFQGGISSNLVEKTIKSSTIVVHVEGLDTVSKQLTRYSFSTKIGESLGSGVCLFAYGPAEVASIEYLRQYNVACVCTNKAELQGKLSQILADKQLRQYYEINALELAFNRHNSEKNADLFYKMICDAIYGLQSKNPME